MLFEKNLIRNKVRIFNLYDKNHHDLYKSLVETSSENIHRVENTWTHEGNFLVAVYFNK